MKKPLNKKKIKRIILFSVIALVCIGIIGIVCLFIQVQKTGGGWGGLILAALLGMVGPAIYILGVILSPLIIAIKKKNKTFMVIYSIILAVIFLIIVADFTGILPAGVWINLLFRDGYRNSP